VPPHCFSSQLALLERQQFDARKAPNRCNDAVSASPPDFFGLFIGHSKWARLDSNQGPTDYESAALTS
jgi:hypothetical protein